MGNSFNISVKPEIAAAVVKIDAIDTVVDAIRGTDVPNIQTNINVNETTILANQDILDLIRGTDVVDIQANIDANETKIDTIDGIVDAIKLKTDLIPQNVRGSFHSITVNVDNSAFQTIIDLTGSGKLIYISFKTSGLTDTFEIKLTIDGIAFETFTHTGSSNSYIMYLIKDPINLNPPSLALFASADTFPCEFNVEFSDSLLLEARRSIGDTENIYVKTVYNLDDF